MEEINQVSAQEVKQITLHLLRAESPANLPPDLHKKWSPEGSIIIEAIREAHSPFLPDILQKWEMNDDIH